MELLGFESVIDEINKLFRTKLCPNTMGQVVTDAMVYPPDKTGPSYHLYKEVHKTPQLMRFTLIFKLSFVTIKCINYAKDTSEFIYMYVCVCVWLCVIMLILVTVCVTKERELTQTRLRSKADLVYQRFNSVPGVSCRQVRGAMYAFPRIELPQRAIEEAEVNTHTNLSPSSPSPPSFPPKLIILNLISVPPETRHGT